MVGVPFVVAVALRPPSFSRASDHSGINPRGLVTAPQVGRLVVPNQSVKLFASEVRKNVREHVVEMESNKTFEVIERKGF